MTLIFLVTESKEFLGTSADLKTGNLEQKDLNKWIGILREEGEDRTKRLK